MDNILLFGSGTQAYALAKDLSKGGYNVLMLCGLEHNYGDDSKYVTKVLRSALEIEDETFLNFITNIIDTENISAIIPMGDKNAEFLSRHKDIMTKSVKYQFPDLEIFQKGYNKESLMKVCEENAIPHPQTTFVNENLNEIEIDNLKFPVLIKPNITCGGRGMTLVNSEKELIKKYPIIREKYGPCHLQQFIPPGGRQVEVQLYINEDGELLYSSVISKFRWYPVKAGSNSCSETIRNDEIVKTLHTLLKKLNWIGFADFDTIEHPKTHELLVMELNPRVPACVKNAIVSGVNWGQIIANEYLGKTNLVTNYSPGKILRHIGFEVLWFIRSPARFKTTPNWFKFFGKNIYFQDFDFFDQKPFWIGTYQNIKKLFSPEFRKSKSGTNAK